MEKVEQVAKNIFLKMAQQSATLCLTGQNWQAYNHERAVAHKSVVLDHRGRLGRARGYSEGAEAGQPQTSLESFVDVCGSPTCGYSSGRRGFRSGSEVSGEGRSTLLDPPHGRLSSCRSCSRSTETGRERRIARVRRFRRHTIRSS